MKQLKDKNQANCSCSLAESYSMFMGNATCNDNEQKENSMEMNFEKFSMYEDSKYESHVSCSFENVKL